MDSLLIFADDWGRHPSSCQHLTHRLRKDYPVLWANTIGTRSPRIDGFTFLRGWEKIRSWSRSLRQIDEQMWVVDVPMLPSTDGPVSARLNKFLVTRYLKWCLKRTGLQQPTVLTTIPHVPRLLGDIGQRGLIYYCTDDFSHWPSADQAALAAAERELCEQSDMILAVSDELIRRHQQNSKCVFFPHAVDFEHFAESRNATVPSALEDIPGPLIGFFGLVYEKLDFALLSQLAASVQPASIVMIGPIDYCDDEFAAMDNVHLVGPKPYEELPSWISGLDVLLMPYVQDEMIRQSNPLKLRECLATGKPTVCVELPEARKFEPHVQVASNELGFIEAVRAALNETDNAATASARQDSVRSETWDARASELKGIIESLSNCEPHNEPDCPTELPDSLVAGESPHNQAPISR